MSFSNAVDSHISTDTAARKTATALYARVLKFPFCYGKKRREKRKKKKRRKEREKKVVGGEGQSSATLSLINRATVIDYLE